MSDHHSEGDLAELEELRFSGHWETEILKLRTEVRRLRAELATAQTELNRWWETSCANCEGALAFDGFAYCATCLGAERAKFQPLVEAAELACQMTDGGWSIDSYRVAHDKLRAALAAIEGAQPGDSD